MKLRCGRFCLRVILTVCIGLFAPVAATTSARSASEEVSKTIVFVCLHGAVNSQMAAAYINKAAGERALPYTAISRGIDLYPSIPIRIRDGLALDGLDPANAPSALTPVDSDAASLLLAFHEVPTELLGKAGVIYWPGVPLGVNDHDAARDAILRRIDELIPTLAR
jgi:hypothetical protein